MTIDMAAELRSTSPPGTKKPETVRLSLISASNLWLRARLTEWHVGSASGDGPSGFQSLRHDVHCQFASSLLLFHKERQATSEAHHPVSEMYIVRFLPMLVFLELAIHTDISTPRSAE